MKTSKNNDRKSISKSIVFSLVFLVLGFIMAYSYSLSNQREAESDFTGASFFEQKEQYRKELIEQQERNKELRDELDDKQKAVQEFERSVVDGEENYTVYAREAEELRRFLGLVPVKGQGLKVTLEDGDYMADHVNPSDYIVNESHVFQVINELYLSGAEAIAVNGQRIHGNSRIVCTGPVITVDGIQHPAPFTIEAIGSPGVLNASMQLSGGVQDQLVNDNLIVTLDLGQVIRMPTLLSELDAGG
ncbi:DUF881 domain-containing protein [Planococcus sp. CP5-4]|uniref:DUF881 domain-containing protein n=1 Tax=unclassified Planococcus (in: firmicutes) TaxID=2662419 RepID=UPI001C24FBF6|nr:MULTISPECIES: DUF881 domain-containing protein [unclassified Planococcus (in: firmicutes)]MBU9672151.1 DUF881 domain-containing protein [Planococcus sp. CP5-4_YE]MBV0907714.1 DUF881 domain-containing protein [Planococcus sp. CP5-4_UN]MBW6062881.1 DUF881 domain-containing protein [Planococcus sp. CP5-4]